MKNYIEQYLEQIQRGKCIVSKRIRRQYEALVDDIKNPLPIRAAQNVP